jgi:SAM-dependent methyltransferase
LSEWFDTFFDALAHDVWEALVPDAASDVEAAWLADRLALAADRPRRLLDVPAGRGRLACRLADRGHLVTAVDFAPDAITPLAAALPPGSTVTPLLGDMRDLGGVLPAGTRFDGAYCMGNSFGYLDADDTARFLAGVAGVLTAGAPFVVDAPPSRSRSCPTSTWATTWSTATRTMGPCSPTGTGTTSARRRSSRP